MIRRAILIVLAVCGVAAAQPSGGSVGGGDWGGGGGGGGAVGVGDGGGDVSTEPHGDWRGLVLLGIGLAGVAGFLMLPRRPRRWSGARRTAHVGVLHVAFAPGAREALTDALRTLARTARPQRAEGRARLVHELVLLLRRHARDAAYVGYELEPPSDRPAARTRFEQYAHDARARFVAERIRNANGIVAERWVGSETRDGFTVVTLVVATREPVLEPVRDRASLASVLGRLANVLPFDVIACELIWMPADGGEPLSSLVVEDRVPGLVKLPEAIAGPCTCAYCGSRYPIENAICPRCGAHPVAA